MPDGAVTVMLGAWVGAGAVCLATAGDRCWRWMTTVVADLAEVAVVVIELLPAVYEDEDHDQDESSSSVAGA